MKLPYLKASLKVLLIVTIGLGECVIWISWIIVLAVRSPVIETAFGSAAPFISLRLLLPVSEIVIPISFIFSAMAFLKNKWRIAIAHPLVIVLIVAITIAIARPFSEEPRYVYEHGSNGFYYVERWWMEKNSVDTGESIKYYERWRTSDNGYLFPEKAHWVLIDRYRHQ